MSVSSEDAAAAATEESKRMAVQPPESQSLPLCFLWLLTFFKGQLAALAFCLKETSGSSSCRKHCGLELCQMDVRHFRREA